MALPELHLLKPQDLGYVCHQDPPGQPNGFISRKLASTLRLNTPSAFGIRLFSDPQFFVCLPDTPWWDGNPLIEQYVVVNNTFVLILEGPAVLNNKEWFYRILTDDLKDCWFPALKILNAHPIIINTNTQENNE
jgi:hypothetical protein